MTLTGCLERGRGFGESNQRYIKLASTGEQCSYRDRAARFWLLERKRNPLCVGVSGSHLDFVWD